MEQEENNITTLGEEEVVEDEGDVTTSKNYNKLEIGSLSLRTGEDLRTACAYFIELCKNKNVLKFLKVGMENEDKGKTKLEKSYIR